jgi:hypothetical protein
VRAIASSNVVAVEYDAMIHTLTVEFRSGAVYAYYGVPESLYRELLAAQPHPWSAVGWIIRGYPYRRLGRVA